MRAKQHFLIALGALTLCSGAAMAAAQDEGRQPSPETTTQPSLPQSMPPEQSNMEDQMLTRGESERSNAEAASASTGQSPEAQDDNVNHLVQASSVQTPRSQSVPQPSYPQQSEDELSARSAESSSAASAEASVSQTSAAAPSQTTESATSPADTRMAQAEAPQPPQPMQEQAPPGRTSTQDETSLTRNSTNPAAPTVSEEPVQSESAMDQGNTQLTDTSASVQAKFDALDSDHDGTIDRQEAAASDALAAQFDALDSSGDGKLSLAEFTAASNLASIRVDRKVHQE